MYQKTRSYLYKSLSICATKKGQRRKKVEESAKTKEQDSVPKSKTIMIHVIDTSGASRLVFDKKMTENANKEKHLVYVRRK
jgi:hypothetical protein